MLAPQLRADRSSSRARGEPAHCSAAPTAEMQQALPPPRPEEFSAADDLHVRDTRGRAVPHNAAQCVEFKSGDARAGAAASEPGRRRARRRARARMQGGRLLPPKSQLPPMKPLVPSNTAAAARTPTAKRGLSSATQPARSEPPTWPASPPRPDAPTTPRTPPVTGARPGPRSVQRAAPADVQSHAAARRRAAAATRRPVCRQAAARVGGAAGGRRLAGGQPRLRAQTAGPLWMLCVWWPPMLQPASCNAGHC